MKFISFSIVWLLISSIEVFRAVLKGDKASKGTSPAALIIIAKIGVRVERKI
jgi:hypothetical protein